MSEEPEDFILQYLRQMRAEIGDIKSEISGIKSEMATKSDIKDLKSDLHSLAADFASDLVVHRKETTEQIAGLRRAVVEYHSSTIGHGILISELEARVRRVEQHLDLPSIDSH